MQSLLFLALPDESPVHPDLCVVAVVLSSTQYSPSAWQLVETEGAF